MGDEPVRAALDEGVVPSASVDFVMGAQGQQEDGLLALVLRVLEDDTQIVTRATGPTTGQWTAQFVSSQ